VGAVALPGKERLVDRPDLLPGCQAGQLGYLHGSTSPP
jgi:hypothetical protein